MSRTISGAPRSVPPDPPNILLMSYERAEQREQPNDKLVPPLHGFTRPRIIRVSKLFAEKDVEAWKPHTFPILAPFFAATQRHIRLEDIST